MSPWSGALLFVALSAAIIGGSIAGALVLRTRSKAPSPLQRDTYECGEEPDGTAWVQFHPRYYLVALVFVLFDVEAAFLLPWALNLRELGDVALVDMGIFLGVLLLGWVYALKKGALKWQ